MSAFRFPDVPQEPSDAMNRGVSEKTLLSLLYGATILLSAFLLFQVQPMVGKMLLPWFGGTVAVWSTCLLFFQVVLLLGYLYAHWTSRLLAARTQTWLHLCLLAISLLALPVALNSAWKPDGNEDPALLILALMTASVGLPYFMLSSTGPLVQAWFSRERPGSLPYRLFALSNLGSMLGLLSYPTLLEPALATPDISRAWSAAYAIFAILCSVLAWRSMRGSGPLAAQPAGSRPTPPGGGDLLLWTALAACASVLLMGVTSHLTQDVAPMPFLWVLPLCVYLLSFIFCFEGRNWYRRAWFLPAFVAWFAVMNHDLLQRIPSHGIALPVVLYCGGLFIACMACHGELARLKPHPDHLTLFYLMIAFGGALGGVFVALLAPRLFSGYDELPAASIVTALLLMTLALRQRDGATLPTGRQRLLMLAGATAVALASIFITVGTLESKAERRLLARNFYGTLSIKDISPGGRSRRELVHGAILHGEQSLEAGRRRQATTYYGENGGAGMAVLATRQQGQPQRVGVIGLGAGTMAAYGRAGDYYRFYEINPLVADLAQTQFSFLADCPAMVETAMGDARLSLEREAPQRFDVLVVDAFSGDSIPVHLLTREAFSVYFRHMKPGGILAVHISNHNLDLAPVVKHAVDHFGRQARLVDAAPEEDLALSGSKWILISDTNAVFEGQRLRDKSLPLVSRIAIRPWTDDYSSIYSILK
jgi:hypothetical protein